MPWAEQLGSGSWSPSSPGDGDFEESPFGYFDGAFFDPDHFDTLGLGVWTEESPSSGTWT